MDDLELLLDLHVGGARQGPGSAAATRRALALSGLASRRGLAVADVDCGTGASTLVLAVSEITWLTAERPEELTARWEAEYPEIGPASAKLAVLESAGYAPIGYFPLPPPCWLEEYHEPLRDRLDAFLARHDGSADARPIVEAERREIDLYATF